MDSKMLSMNRVSGSRRQRAWPFTGTRIAAAPLGVNARRCGRRASRVHCLVVLIRALMKSIVDWWHFFPVVRPSHRLAPYLSTSIQLSAHRALDVRWRDSIYYDRNARYHDVNKKCQIRRGGIHDRPPWCLVWQFYYRHDHKDNFASKLPWCFAKREFQ